MFEDFSFSTPSSRPARLTVDADDRLMVDCDTLISPLSSRCPSPQSSRFRTLPRPRSSVFRSPPPTSVPFSHDPKRLSISTLTQKLHEHSLQTPDNPYSHPHHRRPSLSLSPNAYAAHVLTPPDTDHDDDELSPGPSSNASPTSYPADDMLSPPCGVQGQAQAYRSGDISPGLQFGFGPGSSPEPGPNPAPWTTSTPDHLSVRLQRQRIAQLQCSHTPDALRRSSSYRADPDPNFDPDACHPSSLPPRSSPRRRAATLARSRFGPGDAPSAALSTGPDPRLRRKSSAGAVLSSRIDKSHYGAAAGSLYAPGFGREGSKRGDPVALRRKSVVSAALASVVER
ncbi:hypothetical protein NUU61_008303 [Penicillium alfredii]|uniref:Uncharacterized protein n=1 Tax=Penicillium alfredii TaxID=1506179 RepID=A0A9W9ESE1_9EURO|nr:uncharacterized protein NUU61_008303 [Penicillium alfredii]KAJ5086996.1 hypothetical protein NUU61_008303 [Penicillium alfredii]